MLLNFGMFFAQYAKMSPTIRIDGLRRVDVGVADHELLEHVVLDRALELFLRDALLLGREDVERHHRHDRAVHGHRHRHRSSGMRSNRIRMSRIESIATPAMPTSPRTRGWSLS